MSSDDIVLNEEFAGTKPKLKPNLKNSNAAAENKDDNSEAKLKNSKGKATTAKILAAEKKQIAKHFTSEGFGSKSVEILAKRYDLPKDSISDYYNKIMGKVQKATVADTASFSFDNINKWHKLLVDMKVPEQSFYEQSIVMNAIANSGTLPLPENGLDLDAIYKFLGNSLQGSPQPSLNAESMQFMADEFQMLIDEANSPQGDRDCVILNRKLANKSAEDFNSAEANARKSIDPLLLNETIKNALIETEKEQHSSQIGNLEKSDSQKQTEANANNEC